jgi:hypothetical protein
MINRWEGEPPIPLGSGPRRSRGDKLDPEKHKSSSHAQDRGDDAHLRSVERRKMDRRWRFDVSLICFGDNGREAAHLNDEAVAGACET